MLLCCRSLLKSTASRHSKCLFRHAIAASSYQSLKKTIDSFFSQQNTSTLPPVQSSTLPSTKLTTTYHNTIKSLAWSTPSYEEILNLTLTCPALPLIFETVGLVLKGSIPGSFNDTLFSLTRFKLTPEVYEECVCAVYEV